LSAKTIYQPGRKCVANRCERQNYGKSFWTACDLPEVGAQTKTLDADLQRGTSALEEMLEERFQTEGTLDGVVDFADLAVSEFSPARADGRVVAQSMEEEFDFAQGEAHFTGEAYQEHTIEGVAGITPLAAGTVRRDEEAHFFVVTEGGGVKAGAGGEFPDFHFSFPGVSLDLKLTLTSSMR